VLQITPQMRILVALEAVDGRKGIDSLVQLCREKLASDPFSGCVFIFVAAARFRSEFLLMTARDSGWHKNGFPKGVSSGGQPEPGRHAHWKRIKHSYSLQRVIQIRKPPRCGGESVDRV
jgi:IS66 Orf2 like protein